MNDTVDAIEAARAVVERRYPACDAAFLAGSVVRGEATDTSDLDLVVITSGGDAPFRESFRALGWPVEAFIHTPGSLHSYFAADAARRRPSLPTMCAEGIVLRDRDGLAGRIKDEARELLDRGPEPLTDDEITRQRYALTDLLDDFEGSRRFEETIVIAAELATAATDLVLSSKRRWLGRGKWLPRALRRADPAAAERLTAALGALVHDGNREPLAAYARDALDLVGGRLFEGYKMGGSAPDALPPGADRSPLPGAEGG